MLNNLLLDGTKIAWYPERITSWLNDEPIVPITIDMALTRACNYKCVYCYSKLQENKRFKIKWEHIERFLNDCADLGVKGVSLVSDGESSVHPDFIKTLVYGRSIGLAMAAGSNGYNLCYSDAIDIIKSCSYFRFNISAADPYRYATVHGVPPEYCSQVIKNIKLMVGAKEDYKGKCTIGMQMVLMPEFQDQIIPLSKLAIELGVDYLIIKHCSDDEHGTIGVDYAKYKGLEGVLKEAEELSGDKTKIVIKWSKIRDGNIRSYKSCYGPPFILQISGSGLVSPCGMLFNDKYKRHHIGNITKQSFKEMWLSENYWKIMRSLWSPPFNAKVSCGCLCLQHNTNKYLDDLKEGRPSSITSCGDPQHLEFI